MPLDHVLSPLKINKLEIKNRVLRTSHGTSMGYGDLSDDLIAYHEARGKGGCGMSGLEAASVHWSGPMTLHAWDDSIIPRYELLMKKIRPTGMKVYSQINHMGMYQGAPWQRPWSASEFQVPMSPMLTYAMTKDDIAEMIDAFVQAARRAVEGGLDGVEVHGAHNFLIQQFISPVTNQRTDEYGGSFENRIRFYLEILRAIRKQIGPDVMFGTRVGPHNFPGGLNVDEHVDVVTRLQQENVLDYINISHGSSNNSYKIIGAMHEDTGYELHMSVPVSRAVQLPTFVTGRFRTLEDADAIIAAGDADMVGMTRAHIADPDIVRKTMAGKAHEVRPCIGCNQGCIGGLNQGRVGCTVNVAAGQELTLNEDLMTPAETPKRVLIIGGGPSGMEAARVAALRGHTVILAEASDKLGGTTRVARLAPKHSSIGDIADWLEAEMDRQGVEVRLNTYADAALVDELAPDAVILATGASPRMDGRVAAAGNTVVTGSDQDHVVSTQQLLTGRHNQIGENAVVLDDVGAYEAIGAAEFLVEQGAHVTFVTTQPVFAPRMQGALVSTPALERLQASGRFTLMTRAHVTRIAEKSVEIGSLDNWPAQTVEAETVVLVTLNKPNTDLRSAIEAKGIPVSVVGDATGPEFLPTAIRKGHLAARTL